MANTVTEYREEDFLMLSGIQHFAFCRRQWALIHIEQQWEENVRTFEGRMMHDNAHNPDFHEKRKSVLTVRALRIFSRSMGISGECDVVEFHEDESGIPLHGYSGLYKAIPIEYKRGKPKDHDADELQLAAQAMCLEEMLVTKIEKGFLYYGDTRRRAEVVFTCEIKEKVKKCFEEMHSLYERRYTPKVKTGSFCINCSLFNCCMPQLCKDMQADKYVEEVIKHSYRE